MLLLIGPLGLPEIIVILVLTLIIVGPKKLPELGRSLGKGIREFKKGTSGLMDSLNEDMNQAEKSKPATPKADESVANDPRPAPKPAQPAQAKAQADEAETVVNLEDEGSKG